MASAITDRARASADLSGAAPPELEVLPEALGLLDDLHAPDLVISSGHLGPERRRRGRLARIRRATFVPRRWFLTVESAVLLVTVAVVAAVVLAPGSAGIPGTNAAVSHHGAADLAASSRSSPNAAPPTASAPPAPAPAVPAPAPAPGTTPSAPPTAAPTPSDSPAPASAPGPDQLGAEALTLVRYPWQRIPGYTIEFLPIADAPSPGFDGNTTFVWGRTGGTSVLYVYPGETAERLAGIIAFEIGHEVDAAAVEPAGGETQIESILDFHPSSWAPNCDCAEQDYLSGWYAAAFSNYWSPGVGDWSRLPVAPPSGATLAEVAPWLDPPIA